MATRKEQREATHQKVMAAVTDRFFNHGFKQTTIRDIADQAGVSVGTVMAVGDKAALLVKMFDEGIGLMHEMRANAVEAVVPTEEDPVTTAVDRVLAVVEPFIEVFATQDQLARQYASILTTGEHDSVIFNDLAETLRHEFADVLLAEGFDPEEAEGAAETIHLAYLGTLFKWSGSGHNDPAIPIDELRRVVFRLVKGRKQ